MNRQISNKIWARVLNGIGWTCLLLMPVLRAETLPFKSYTTSDGLAHDRVNRIVRDSRGFLWFCTSEGLSRFDGYEFKNYTEDDGLPHRTVMDFLETRSGQLWIATSNGLVFFDPRGTSARRSERIVGDDTGHTPMFRVVRPTSMKYPQAVWVVQDLIEDSRGTIWVASSDGLYNLDKEPGSLLQRFDVPASVENGNEDFYRLLEDPTGAIWAATQMGLYRIGSDRSSIQTIHPKMRAGSLLLDHEGKVWVGSVGGIEGQIGLHVYTLTESEATRIRTYRKRDGLADDIWLNSLLQTSDGRIIVGLGAGLCEFAPQPDPNLPQFRILSKQDVVELAEDISGNVWLSTNSSGLRRLARGGFVNFTEADNLRERRINSIVSGTDGHVYVLSELNKIYRVDGKSLTGVLPRNMDMQSWGRGNVTFRDHTGAWWIAGNLGLQRYPPVEKLEDLATLKPQRTYTTKDGLFTDVIFQLLEDSRGDIWIGTIGHPVESLLRWERSTETLHQYTVAAYGLPPGNPVTALAEDHGGNIWIGFYSGGVARFRNGRFELFGDADNLPLSYIGNIFTDSAGRVWIATSSRGVVRVDEPTAEKVRFVDVTTQQGLSSNQANCTTEDDFGRIYVSTGRGVNRLDMKTGRIKVFTIADGLPENIVTQCRRDREGALWFGTWNGLARYVPPAEELHQAPPVFLSDLQVNGERFDNLSQLGEAQLENLQLEPEQRQLQIEFFGLSLGVGESLRYQYKLGDGEWSEPSEQRNVNLNLSPGSYNFLVRAITAEGVVSDNPARVSFAIARPVWQRWWFLFIVALALAATGYAIYRYRLAQLLKLERVRTRIASDLHDDIGSSLSQIAILSEVARHKAGDNGAREPLRLIADTSRDLVDSMSDIVWAINPQKDHLSDLIHRMRRFAGDTFDSTGVGYRFHFDDTTRDIAVGADLRREIYLIFKECVNNTAKHSAAEEVSISVLIDGEQVTTELKDNGVGFDVQAALNGEVKGYGGNGLLNMQRRAERLGGKFDIVSAPAEGTTIIFSIPTAGGPDRLPGLRTSLRNRVARSRRS
ncbi:MAG TPA: two-component regulator propeller domain-containing protein [Pyrinomonadaceae bacterium]|nr:two-component regulator propeller domain-containing protein [Pyrinomonadaceae bacterium]